MQSRLLWLCLLQQHCRGVELLGVVYLGRRWVVQQVRGGWYVVETGGEGSLWMGLQAVWRMRVVVM